MSSESRTSEIDTEEIGAGEIGSGEIGSDDGRPTPVAGNTSAVGSRWPRADGPARVRGTFRYVRDVPPGACASVAIHRGTRPHAVLRDVDVSRALEAPGVIDVITGARLYEAFGRRMFTGPAFSDQPPLAHGKVRYVGEPVAAVVADDLGQARAAADLIDVDYQDLDPVHDLDTALAGEAFVHDVLTPSAVFGDLRHLSGVTGTNVNYEFALSLGDVENDEAATAVKGEFWSPPVHHVPIELPCTDAYYLQDRIELLSTTQTPSYVRQTISDLLGLPLNRVRVRTTALGGSFGAKMYDRLEPLAATLAWLCKRSVRVTATREEAFLLTTRHGARVGSTMTCDDQGRISSATADLAYDTGAYADVGPRIAGKSGMVSLGPYRVPNAAIRSRCVYTNKPSAGPFRGFGVPQVTWSHESLVDELARARGDDPVQFRRRNLLREGEVAYMGTRMHSADFVGCLDGVTEAIGWDTPLEPSAGSRWLRGRGVAVGIKAVLTPTVANAVLHLNQDNTATLLISTVDMGQGSDTIMPQIVAEVLCLDQQSVRTVPADTDTTPYDTITAGSRSTYHTGNAVRLAADKMRDRLLEIAARRTGARLTDLKLVPGGIVNTTTQQTTAISELIHAHFGARGTTLTVEANFTTSWEPYDKATGRSPKVTEHWFASAAAVELTIDRHTGRITLDHLAVAADVGRAINPTLVEQQLKGAAIMGIGHALFEELVFAQGQMINGTLLDYQLPSILDLPRRLTPIIVESPHRTGPFGAKGVGESAIIPICPSIANAVRDATGLRITRFAAVSGTNAHHDGRSRGAQMKIVELTVNGRRRELPAHDDELLLDTLRDRLGATSVREGCGVGACGACTVLVSGRSVSSCLARTVRYHGSEILTADGLAEDDTVVEAFVAESAMQCGYCIPGFVLMAHELLAENPDPSDEEIAEHLEGNICRCGTYLEIIAAIRRAVRVRAAATAAEGAAATTAEGATA